MSKSALRLSVVVSAIIFLIAPGIEAQASTPSAPVPPEYTGEPSSINELVEGAMHYDGWSVTITGEVIGDIMRRGAYGWVNINDGTNAIGVWAPINELEKIRSTGRYQISGDMVRVQGTFSRSDPAHNGDLLIRAASIDIVRRGEFTPAPLRWNRIYEAIAALTVMTLLATTWWRRRNQRQ